MNAAQCKGTCGEPHGVVCTLVEGLEKDFTKLETRIDKIEGNRRAALYFLFTAIISLTTLALSIYDRVSERRDHGNNSPGSQKNVSPIGKSGALSGGWNGDLVGGSYRLNSNAGVPIVVYLSKR